MIYKNPDKLITARKVAGLLAETKMSQERYAKMLHLSQPAISGKLSGTVKFTANDIWKTAVIFGVSTDYLYGLTDMRMREEAETERQTGIRTVNRGEPGSHSPRQPRNV